MLSKQSSMSDDLSEKLTGRIFKNFCSWHCCALIEFLISRRLLLRVFILSESFLIDIRLTSEGVQVVEDAPSCVSFTSNSGSERIYAWALVGGLS